jgi:hypothetical protein
VRNLRWRRSAALRWEVTAADLLARSGPDGPSRPGAGVEAAVAPEAGPAGPVGHGGFAIPEALLADLHDPRLTITEEYVGPDPLLLGRRQRRALHQAEVERREWRPGTPFPSKPLGVAPSLRVRHLVAAVVVTVVSVVPVTLALAQPSDRPTPSSGATIRQAPPATVVPPVEH